MLGAEKDFELAESLAFGGLEKGLDFEAQLVALGSSALNLGLNLLEGFAQGLDLLELELRGFSEVSSGEEELKSEDEGWNESGAESQGSGMAEGLEEPVGNHGGGLFGGGGWGGMGRPIWWREQAGSGWVVHLPEAFQLNLKANNYSMSVSSIDVSKERKLQLIHSLPGFAWLPGEAAERLAEVLQGERYAAGSSIVQEKQIGEQMYFIESGEVEVTVAGAGGEVMLGTMGAGEIFGEIALLSDAKRRRASVSAKTEVSVLVLSVRSFEELVEAFPEVRTDLAECADALSMARMEALMQARRQSEGSGAS